MVASVQKPLLTNRLSYRSASIQDLDRCFQVCGAGFAYSDAIRHQVPQVWQQLLRQNVLVTTVIEAADYPKGQRIVGFGAAAFVTDAFMEVAKRRDRPYVRELFVQCILAGNSPVLTLAEARSANQQNGLNLFFFNDTLANPDLSEEALSAVYEKWSEALYTVKACQIKEILWEFYGDTTCAWPQRCGLHYRQDWREFWQQHPEQTPPANQRPYLVGLTREESKAHYGTHSSYLFMHTPARYLFTELQQELLRRALAGETDEELGQSLNLALSTVKKRWQAIYDQVLLLAPDILEEVLDKAEPGNGMGTDAALRKRGSEKRRYLLNYLRQHPEEIHPLNAIKASAMAR